jgi:hypothetical protein
MKCLRYVLFLFAASFSYNLYAQADFISLGDRQYDLLNRLEIKLRKDSVLNFSAVKPYDRRIVTERLTYIQQLSNEGKINLSAVDKYNLQLSLQDNFDWRKDLGDTALKFKDVFSKKITTHAPYIGIKQGDFSAYLSPLINLQLGKDNNVGSKLFNNQRGIAIRGTFTKKMGFYTAFTTHQERDPLYVQQYEQKFSAVPGAGYYKNYQTDGYDYFDARGGIMVNAAKGIDLQFAYDKVFIGNGYRSLILSDFSNSFLFLKANFHFWKFNYYNLFGELTSAYKRGPDFLRPKKYMALHMVEFNAKNFTIGFFEDVMFGRSGGFELNYLNPIIFYRAMEQQLGSPDKVALGTNIKWNIAKNTQFYSQLVINEFVIKEVLHYSNGAVVNKQALQLGIKKIDVFGIKNLDAQLEINLIRPFVYEHYDTAGSFTHYNQPLAHPQGANLREFIGIVKYQPINKLSIEAKIIYNEQGLDSAGLNFGSNPFRFYTDAPRAYGFKIGSGILAKNLLVSGTITYEVTPNIFFDLNAVIRKYKQANITTTFNSNIFNASLRINLARRVFDF